ncbi:MAG TPA: hypothetical protein VN045_07380, partial [Microbacteriaceae bacterium]|nr:hypothetical protein [Microbacteriaceae bacterium]
SVGVVELFKQHCLSSFVHFAGIHGVEEYGITVSWNCYFSIRKRSRAGVVGVKPLTLTLPVVDMVVLRQAQGPTLGSVVERDLHNPVCGSEPKVAREVSIRSLALATRPPTGAGSFRWSSETLGRPPAAVSVVE